jgi:hypothetical protein
MWRASLGEYEMLALGSATVTRLGSFSLGMLSATPTVS